MVRMVCRGNFLPASIDAHMTFLLRVASVGELNRPASPLLYELLKDVDWVFIGSQCAMRRHHERLGVCQGWFLTLRVTETGHNRRTSRNLILVIVVLRSHNLLDYLAIELALRSSTIDSGLQNTRPRVRGRRRLSSCGLALLISLLSILVLTHFESVEGETFLEMASLLACLDSVI